MKSFQTFIRILKEIQTRPTKYFILLVLAIIGLFSLAYMHNYNIVYLVMFFIFSLAGASSIIGRLNLYELKAEVVSAQSFFANTATPYTLSISNPSEHDSFALECSNHNSESFIRELPALKRKTVTLTCTPLKRGHFSLPDLRISSRFPLPHEILFKEIDLNYKTIVYPEPKGEDLQSFTARNRSFFGEHDDFDGIRPFREGESLSLIHWPSLAKGDTLMSKEFVMLEKSRHLQFDFSECSGNDEERLSQLCLWALECQHKNIPFTINFPTTALDSRKRSHHEILEFLALY